ncbi:MAG: GGDEF domain-containing protein [Pseudomonadales bacterium]|nr:GGDEF domain-containing protein [Pseudomonadales bacterium]MCP5320606.1 GGDEF domain-containing protein [Pseudomonadales bacterium]MCP5336649.1 GGDEF domain-containing protein [Pseudomonadales bacterium]
MRQDKERGWGVQPHVLLGSTVLIAVLMLALVLIPQTLSRQARLEVLRSHVGEEARVAASVVDGDAHRHLIEGHGTAEELDAARAPLLRLHRAWPEARYVYTMGMHDDRAFFVLDTAQDPLLAAERGLRMSRYLEPFQLREEYESDWLVELAAGLTYVNPQYQHDDYGYFLTGHAPIRDSTGQVSGFVGVDFDLEYFLAEEARFRRIELASLFGALLLSLVLGWVYARHHFLQQAELRRHYESSMNDSLSGLLNRRGADTAIRSVMEGGATGHDRFHAALLVDIDHFKQINDTYGHAKGDSVIARLAEVLRMPLHAGAVPVRLGGDEFLLFVPDCDQDAAKRIASRLLDEVRATTASGAAPFEVSVGVAVVQAGEGGFDLLYRRADSALYEAKSGGKNRYAIFDASMADMEDTDGADAFGSFRTVTQTAE